MNAAVTALTSKALVSTLIQSGHSTSSAVARQWVTDGGPAAPSSAEAVSSLWCLPRTAQAGSEVRCELRTTSNESGSRIQLAGSSSAVKLPSLVTTRAHQSSLTFLATIEPAARAQSVAISATLNGTSARDTIQVSPSLAPVLTVPSKQLAKPGSKLSFAIHTADPMELSTSIAAANVPAGALVDSVNGTFEWTPNAQQLGAFDVTFTASNTAGRSATAHVRIDVGSGAPVLNASDGLACSPGAIGTLNGKWLADSSLSDPSGATLELGGTKVKVNGDYVSVLSVSPLQVQFVCPAFDAGTQLRTVAENQSGSTEPMVSTMLEASPQIFAVSHQETNDLVTERNSRIAGYPAEAGDEILIWGSGFGAQADSSNGLVSAKLGGVDADVKSVSAVPGLAGVFIVRVSVPVMTAPGDAVPVQLNVMGAKGGRFSSNSVTMAVEAASR